MTAVQAALLKRSAHLVRRLGVAQEAICRPRAEGAPDPHRGTNPFLDVECTGAAGEPLANLSWDRSTGDLALLSLETSGEPREMPNSLTQAQARSCALLWLRTLDLLGAREAPVSVACTRRTAERRTFHVRSAQRDMQITVDPGTGDCKLLMARARVLRKGRGALSRSAPLHPSLDPGKG